MKEVIPEGDREALEAELTADKFVRKTNNANNELYIVTAHDSPEIMREIGRLRELTFRQAGGGTGEETDIDEFDTSEDCYQQLIVWDPHHKDILGGYRFYIPKPGLTGDEIVSRLSTSHLFNFSNNFKDNYLPYMIELGRSFVQPAYQSTNRARRSLYALDNLWDGLGAILVDNPRMKYFFGKVTMYPRYNIAARDILLYFLEKHFGDREDMVTPIKPMQTGMNREEMAKIFSGANYEEDYKILSRQIRDHHESIPPLINAYMNLSPTMKCFGTAINDEFGDVEETGIMITMSDLYMKKIERHVTTYQRVKYMIDNVEIKLPKI
jgi:hypothetical protein